MSPISLILIPYMTWLSRMSGGGWPKLPWGLDQWLLALPYLLFYPALGWWVILGYLGAVLGLRLGHGRGFWYDRPFKEGSTPEKIEIFIPKNLPVNIQKILIMVLTGLAVTIVLAACLLLHGYWIASLIVAISGAAKAFAYFLPKTEWAELTRGALLSFGIIGAIYFI